MPITLPNATARNYRDWNTQFEFYDADTGALIDFTGAFIAIAIEDNEGCQLVLATTDNGMITIVSTGIIELDVPYSMMNMCPGFYPIGGYYQLNGETIDLFVGELSVQRGVPKI